VGSLSNNGEVTVETIRLDSFWKQTNSFPHVIKIDIEGAELTALEGAGGVLATYKPSIFLTVHSVDLENNCSRLLSEHGYRLDRVSQEDISARPTAVP
jgi:hypothetical protein